MPTEFKIPELGENVESATVAEVLVSEGDTIEQEQPVVELETDKAATEVPSDVAGVIKKVHVSEGDEVDVGQVILTLEDTESDQEEEKDEEEKEEEEKEEEEKKTERKKQPGRTPAGDQKKEPLPAAPSVRRFAREIGVDLADVAASGSNERISIEDVKKQAQRRASSTGAGVPELPDLSQWGEVEREAMKKVRRLTAEHMTRAWTVPQATQFGNARVDELEAFREEYKAHAVDAGGHLSVTVILVKAVAGALKQFPQFNAAVDMESNEIVYRKYCHIGIAMDTDRGLVVPVMRDVDSKNLRELAVEFKQLTDKARNGKLQAEDMTGGCFTVTNAGALGGDLFIPVVNWPETAILGVARSRREPNADGCRRKQSLILPLSLSYDHRLIDGADAVRFMRWLADSLEDPLRLLWQG